MRNDYKKVAKFKGTLYGVGIGPGDPELLTLKAKKILKKVDIIFAPRPNIGSGSMAANIIKNHIQKKTKVKELVFPMTKDKKILERFWRQAALEVYRKLSSGRDAAFVTIGDPFIYSTYIYLLRNIRKLDKDLKIMTIPGISAVNAAASLFDIPLAEADEKFAIIPLPKHLDELKDIFLRFDTVVLMKIGKGLEKLVEFLKKEGFDKFSFFAKRIGCSDEYAARDIGCLNTDKKTSGYLSTMVIRPWKVKRRR